MLYTPLTKLALTGSFEAHKGQRDKSGMPYAYFLFHLEEQTKNEDTTIVALFHDDFILEILTLAVASALGGTTLRTCEHNGP